MSLDKIRHYRRISENITSSGQPEEDQFTCIAAAGFQMVINLAMPNSDFAIPEEGNIVTALKMSYVHIPVPFDAPDISHLKTFINILGAVPDKKIWVHCAMNYRVSAFLYHFQRVIHGESSQQAMKVMLPSWQPNEIWQRFMSIPPDKIK